MVVHYAAPHVRLNCALTCTATRLACRVTSTARLPRFSLSWPSLSRVCVVFVLRFTSVVPNGYPSLLLTLVVPLSSGKNWVDEAFVNDRGQSVPGWELPATWPEDMPTQGSLKVRYTSARSAGCYPDVDCRERLLQRVRWWGSFPCAVLKTDTAVAVGCGDAARVRPCSERMFDAGCGGTLRRGLRPAC